MSERENLFNQGAPAAAAPSKPADAGPLDDLHVAPPACDCHQAAECAHDTTIECDECGVTYPRGSQHICGDANYPPRPVMDDAIDDLLKKAERAVEYFKPAVPATSLGGRALSELHAAVERVRRA